MEWVGRLDVRTACINSRIGLRLREQLDRPIELCQEATHLLDTTTPLTQVLHVKKRKISCYDFIRLG